MKILYVALDAKNYAIRICNELAKQGHEITAFVLEDDYFDNECEMDVEENINLIQLPEEDFFNADKFIKNHLDTIKKINPDIIFGVHVTCSSMIEYLGTVLKKPKVMMLLDIPTHLIRIQEMRKKQWKEYLKSLLKMDSVIFNTHIARDEFKKLSGTEFPDENVITYPTFLPDKYFKSGVKIAGDYVISVCRLTAEKNCLIIPYAISKLNSINKYVAVGKDIGQLDEIKKKCKEFEIEFEHYEEITDEKKFELIKNSSMMIYPQNTPYIGGLPPYEGMFVGKPVIVANLTVLNKLYKDNCLYFKNNNIGSLSSEIALVHSIKREFLAEKLENSAEFAKKDASFKKMADGIIKILEDKK